MSRDGWFSLHTHSKFSASDAMPDVSAMVGMAVQLGYPALGLTDHGTVAGSVQLYKACRKAGIEPLPGEEFYITPDREHREQSNYHITIAAYSETGYRNLVGLHNLAQRNFFYRPRIDLADIAALAADGRLQGLVGSSGCFFGLVAQTLVTRGPSAAQRLVETLAGWFPRFYVELHNHEVTHLDEPDYARLVPARLAGWPQYLEVVAERDGIGELKNKTRREKYDRLSRKMDALRKEARAWVKAQHTPTELYADLDLALELVKVAEAAGVPYIIAQDSHYLRPEDQPFHDALKSLVSFSDDPSEAIFPGGPYSMYGYDEIVPLWPEKVLAEAVANLGDLADRSCVRLPELEEFRMRVPDVTLTGDAYSEMETRVIDALYDRGMGLTKLERYDDRLNSELATVKASGYADMLLLTAEVCDFMRAQGIWYQVRGSASGSLVVWLLGISQIDPIEMDLRMDRFMSGDRLKPPDIDLDVEHKRRDEVVAFLANRWTVRQIGSHMKLTLADDELNPEEDNSKGSLAVKYYSTARKHGAHINEWSKIPPEDQAMLKGLSDYKLYVSHGTHAAGYLVSPDEAIAKTVPMTWIASSKKFVTTFAMKDVEALGFVKLDLLGLRTLTAIRVACEALGWTQADYESIPLDDKSVFTRISNGDTSAIFQLDGWAMTKGCRELKPKTLEDLIAAQALYRPATMNSGATRDFIARRAKREPVPDRHPDIMAECKSTYGVLLYQEQVIGVLRRMEMPADELTEMLSAVKASNELSAAAAVALAAAKPRISELARARGWNEDDIEWLLEALVAYGEYSFNRAHAASYGLTAYRQAYLAQHHPTQFWLGIVTAYEEHKRELAFVRAAREHQVLVLPPHVNDSGISYRLDLRRNGIRKGLSSIKSIGVVTASELVRHQPYESLSDLAMKVIPQKVTGTLNLGLGKKPKDCGGAIAVLDDVGALEGLT
jgi:DNA polymerase-3 subunit alpha